MNQEREARVAQPGLLCFTNSSQPVEAFNGYFPTFYVVMESGSGVRLHAIPGSPEATQAMEAGETRARLHPAKSVLNQAAEADRVELDD